MTPEQGDDLQSLNLAILQAGEVPCAGDDLVIAEDEADQLEGAHWCARCPILDQCRAYGLAWPQEAGVYGGLTQAQRQQRPPRRKRTREPPTAEELDQRRARMRERSRRARQRRKQRRQEGSIAC